MRKIYMLDTTLRDGEQTPNVSLTAREKVEIALQLERLGIDRIEAGFPIASKGELQSVHEVASRIKHATVVAFARSREQDIDAAAQALAKAEDACIHLFLATSPIHREYKLNMDKRQVLETAEAAIRYAKRFCGKVQFSAEDASRTEVDFLCDVVAMAIRAGATVVNLPDTLGYTTPGPFGRLFKTVRETVPGIEKIQLSTHCHDDLGLATANTLAAIENGVDQIEGTMNGIGERAGNTSIEEVAVALELHADYYQAKSSLALHEIYQTSRLVSRLTGMPVSANKALIGANAFVHESGIHQDGMLKNRSTYEIIKPEIIGVKVDTLVLGKHSGRHAFRERLRELGYHLEEEQINEAFFAFKELADKKKHVGDDDIRSLLEEKWGKAAAQAFQLLSLHFSHHSGEAPSATVCVMAYDTPYEATATGNGTIDAIYRALDQATGQTVELEDYGIKAVSNGKDSLGEVHVALRQQEIAVSGRGVDTDIMEASAKAYVAALNRIAEKRKKNDHVSIDM